MNKEIAFFDDIVDESCKRLGYTTKEDRDFVADMFDNSLDFIKHSMTDWDMSEIRIPKLGKIYVSRAKLMSYISKYKDLYASKGGDTTDDNILRGRLEEYKYRLNRVETLDKIRINRKRPMNRIWSKSLKKLGFFKRFGGIYTSHAAFKIFRTIAQEQNRINGRKDN